MTNKTELQTERKLDFWVDMHLPHNEDKRENFVRDFIMETSSATHMIDAMIMLFEAFKQAAEEEYGHLSVIDLAEEFQMMFFRYTCEFETGCHAYLDYLKKGVRDYNETKGEAFSRWENDKVLMHIAGYFSQEPERFKRHIAEWEAKRKERSELKEHEALPAIAPKFQTAEVQHA
jgi:hypothetical protein